MLSVSRVVRATAPSALPGFLERIRTCYPRRSGEFVGDMIAGHNVFIADIPRKFDAQHARHFSLVESLCITPLFAISMVHYFSSFFLYPPRWKLIPPLMTELIRRTETQHQWLEVLEKKSPADAIAWRAGMMLVQIVVFPLSLILAAIAPQMTHATLERTNHILYQKYACISKDAPAFVEKCMQQSREAESFHSQQLTIPTDFAAAVLVVLLILFLMS